MRTSDDLRPTAPIGTPATAPLTSTSFPRGTLGPTTAKPNAAGSSRRGTSASQRAPAERILLLDQDDDHLRHLAQYLTGHGYRVSTSEDASELPLRLQLEAPDLILLEQSLGELTGTEVLARIRAVSDVPVIILSALSDPVDRIINLEMGADDQVHKSVPQREIMARMRAVLRRTRSAPERPLQGWMMCESRRDVLRADGAGCGLTTAEFSVMRELVAAGGEAVSRRQLSERAFGRPLNPGDRAVDTVICKLRQKLGPGVIVTVRPAGYAFAGFPGVTSP